MIGIVKELIETAGVLPPMDFQFSQIPVFFETQEFFLLASQIITEILTGVAQGIIGGIIGVLFGVAP